MDTSVRKLVFGTIAMVIAALCVAGIAYNNAGPRFDAAVSERYGIEIERQSSLLGAGVGLYRFEGKLYDCFKTRGEAPGLRCRGISERPVAPTKANLRKAGLLERDSRSDGASRPGKPSKPAKPGKGDGQRPGDKEPGGKKPGRDRPGQAPDGKPERVPEGQRS